MNINYVSSVKHDRCILNRIDSRIHFSKSHNEVVLELIEFCAKTKIKLFYFSSLSWSLFLVKITMELREKKTKIKLHPLFFAVYFKLKFRDEYVGASSDLLQFSVFIFHLKWLHFSYYYTEEASCSVHFMHMRVKWMRFDSLDVSHR